MTLQDAFDLLPLPNGKVLRWLLDQGVPFDALYNVKSAWVAFDDAGFDFRSRYDRRPGSDPTVRGWWRSAGPVRMVRP